MVLIQILAGFRVMIMSCRHRNHCGLPGYDSNLTIASELCTLMKSCWFCIMFQFMLLGSTRNPVARFCCRIALIDRTRSRPSKSGRQDLIPVNGGHGFRLQVSGASSSLLPEERI